MFLYKVRMGEANIPEDGYGWMDDETSQRVVLDSGKVRIKTIVLTKKEIEILARNLGFALGESLVSVTRRRYRLTSNPDLQLLHYLALPAEAPKMAVQSHLVKSAPRDPVFFEQLKRASAGAAPVASPTTANAHLSGNSMAHAKKRAKVSSQKNERAHAGKTRVGTQVRVVEDENEPSGDELDGTVNRNVSLERYKRNHIFIDQIFSPFTSGK